MRVPCHDEKLDITAFIIDDPPFCCRFQILMDELCPLYCVPDPVDVMHVQFIHGVPVQIAKTDEIQH
ncbi:hypothetical protein D3C72_2565180 [compost metagenome]